ncbi:MAG: J domain-containing protein [Syntrophales bacterium]|jgi:curved DNA-binding protein|nr:J domain-containing protein [Syntrophales bacterium]MCK9527246.1 J domain-containing protein [Syntrophales bacterium]MDX9921284.1 J domain-containing protein [Syntrophales bacterium]
MSTDYYEILGLTKKATAEDIKKAYRRRALKYHPDRNPGNPQAEAEFKKISEAYAVLSDPEKRKQYDIFGSQDFGRRYSQEDIFRDFDFNSIFREFAFGTRRTGFQGKRRMSRGDDPFAFADLFSGTWNQQGPRLQPERGKNIEYNLDVTLEEAFGGAEKKISLAGGGKKILVRIPPGIATGRKLRLPGKAHPGKHGGVAGDVLITVRVVPHKVFAREGDNLTVSAGIRYSEAVLGTTVEIPTIGGETKRVRIPAGSGPLTKIRMKGYGMPRFRGAGRGDAYLRLSIIIPKSLNKEQDKLIRSMAEKGL